MEKELGEINQMRHLFILTGQQTRIILPVLNRSLHKHLENGCPLND